MIKDYSTRSWSYTQYSGYELKKIGSFVMNCEIFDDFLYFYGIKTGGLGSN
ncbi:hypothetical protein YWY31_35490 [Paenibacillus illinoisensis]